MEDDVNTQATAVLEELNELDGSDPFVVVAVERGTLSDVIVGRHPARLVVVDFDELAAASRASLDAIEMRLATLQSQAAAVM